MKMSNNPAKYEVLIKLQCFFRGSHTSLCWFSGESSILVEVELDTVINF